MCRRYMFMSMAASR